MNKISEQDFTSLCEEIIEEGHTTPEDYWESVYFRVCSRLQVDASRMPIEGEENAPPGAGYVWNLSMKMQSRKRGNFDPLAIGSKILNDAHK